MLKHLKIQDIVMIDSLELTFDEGFTAFTGETGAGKSILLDALSLALGTRGDIGLIRHGKNQAQVIAEFQLGLSHPVFKFLENHGIICEDGCLVFRRLLTRDNKSKAFLNDIPLSVALLKSIGSMILEIHGQFDKLLEGREHKDFLDIFGGLSDIRTQTEACFKEWKEIESKLEEAYLLEKTAHQNFELWKHHLEELQAFNLQDNEEETLLEERTKFLNQDKFQKALENAGDIFQGSSSGETQFYTLHKNLSRFESQYPELLPLLESIDRILIEIKESSSLLEQIQKDLLSDPNSLEFTEERLYALRALARKHQVPPSSLPEILTSLSEKVKDIETQSETIKTLETLRDIKKKEYEISAQLLTQKRIEAAKHLDTLVEQELPSLKLERAQFKTSISPLSPTTWGATGQESIEFQIAPNGGNIFGSLKEIASGGELARILLALKVALAQRRDISVIIFDEIDSGVSGSVSASIGQSLKRLSHYVQVMAITHAPQVAGAAQRHFLIEKHFEKNLPVTFASELNLERKIREIARMLSGDLITEEAHAAAQRLIHG